jgi:hypothetical protein
LSVKRFAHDYAWAAAFDLLDCLRPVIPAKDVNIYFTEMFKRVEAAVGEAIVAIDREREGLKGEKS